MKQEKKKISQLLLERYHLGEVTEEERKHLEKEYIKTPQGAATLAQLNESDASIFEQYPVERVVKDIEFRQHTGEVNNALQKKTWWHQIVSQVPLQARIALICTSVLALMLIPLVTMQQNVPELAQSGERIKGMTPFLKIYKNMGNDYELLHQGQQVSTGDIVQIGYSAAGKKYGMIVSIDGRKTVTLHYPETISADSLTPTLLQGGEHVLTNAYELDDAPLFEMFYFITSDTPVPISPILSLIRDTLQNSIPPTAAATLSLPNNMQQNSFLLTKE